MKTKTTLSIAITFCVLLFCALSVNAQWISVPNGLTPDPFGPPFYPALNSVCFPNDSIGYIVGNNGTILKTTNRGLSWNQLISGTNASLYEVFFIDADTGFIAANYLFLKTTNGGASWTSQANSFGLMSVYFINKDTGYVVNALGEIKKTINGGATWTTQSSGTSNGLYSVCFTDTQIGYIAGNSGTILKTINGGSNWIAQSSGTGSHLQSINFINTNTGYVCGHNGTIRKTVDSGANWISQASGTTNWLSSISAPDINNACAVGQNGKILKTINGGSNWITQSNTSSAPLSDVCFTSADHGVAVGDEGTILITNNGGWCTGIAGQPIGSTTICNPADTSLYYTSAQNATSYVWNIAPSTAGTISGTGDTAMVAWNNNFVGVAKIWVKGHNFCGDGLSSDTTIVSVGAIPATPVISLYGNVLVSDAMIGNQWYNQNGLISGATNQYYVVTTPGDYYAVANEYGCSSDTSNHIQVTPSGIEEVNNNEAVQVYPNPVKDKLIIYLLGNRKKIDFEIFNLTGKQIYKGTFTDEAVVNTSNYTPGGYIIKLYNGCTFVFNKL